MTGPRPDPQHPASPANEVHDTVAAGDAMPTWVRCTKYALTGVLVLFAGLCFYAAGLPPHWFPLMLGCLYLLAAVGLARNLVWGRSLTSWVLVPVVFLVSLGMLGDPEQPEPSGLAHLLGAGAPVWVQWLVLVGFATFLLLPLLVIGWRRNHFRFAWW